MYMYTSPPPQLALEMLNIISYPMYCGGSRPMTSVLTLIPQTMCNNMCAVYMLQHIIYMYMYKLIWWCCHFYTLPTCTFSLCASLIHFSSSYSLSICSPFLCASVMPLFLLSLPGQCNSTVYGKSGGSS